ncbi:MAG: NAD-dependent epimerase/dehydratase family protein [Bacteroides sp.]|jgi:nucleoside-diphosphate-sugar epimerase|nr:NAD-dependent epimerase/dehydratase family protein [Bacteroides sp.]
MKVLVTGGGGFVGKALVCRLVDLGHEVFSFSRRIYPEHQTWGVRDFQGDLTRATEVENACQSMEAVFHVGAKVGIWGTYEEFFRVNVLGTQHVINACIKHKVRKLIYTSSASVVFDGSDIEGGNESLSYPARPVSNYTSTKAQAEQLVINANSESLKTIALRPHLIWGPGDTQLVPKIIQRARSGRLRKPGRKDHLIDTTFIDNFIDAQILAFEKLSINPVLGGRAFFITNGEPVYIWDFINSVIQASGLPTIQKTVPKSLALLLAIVLEKTHQVLRLKKEPYLTRFVIDELCTHHWFDISAAKRDLDYIPRISNREGYPCLSNALEVD